MPRFLLGVPFVLACGGMAAEAPLTVKLGIPRDQALTELHAQQFCFTPDGPARRVETYPRCARAGTEWGEAWVTATYDAGVLIQLERFERYDDDDRAVERWNQLIVERAKASPDARDAGVELRARGPLAAGTRSVKAFKIDATTIVAVYLLTPSPPAQASVLEAIVSTKR